MFQTIVSAKNLKDSLSSEGLVVIDCRFQLADSDAGRQAYKAGHIPGAQYAHLDDDLSSPMTVTSGRHPLPQIDCFERTLQAWGVNSGSQVVCYDDMGGAFAARLWWMLNWLGHTKVAVLDGGIQAWERAGFAFQQDVVVPSQGNFSARADDSRHVDLGFVEDAIKNGKIRLTDARTQARFTAEDNTTDPVAGHVPGAVSLPFAANLAADKTFLPADELQERLERALESDGSETVAMCGSGVTACHNILAAQIAGLPLPRLYVGSWSEWIRNPKRPVATGL